ncbi:hypothetical protein QP980_11365 [Corynebacterium coyleae]|nr:hypothetical protein [Corynebacterium coyleae]MDK8824446.1 hypothetical protein [Corynebacterium coyleae]
MDDTSAMARIFGEVFKVNLAAEGSPHRFSIIRDEATLSSLNWQ